MNKLEIFSDEKSTKDLHYVTIADIRDLVYTMQMIDEDQKLAEVQTIIRSIARKNNIDLSINVAENHLFDRSFPINNEY